jgi:uncharacterized protein YceK
MTTGLRKLLLAASLILSGCATMASSFEEEPKNKIYVGVRQDLTGWTFAHGGFIDLPFSFVADTILLPYTIPKTIANYAAEDKGAPGSAGEDEKVRGGS